VKKLEEIYLHLQSFRTVRWEFKTCYSISKFPSEVLHFMACGPINMHISWVTEKDFDVCFTSRRSNDVYVPNQKEKRRPT
jgi:hypothetical protein